MKRVEADAIGQFGGMFDIPDGEIGAQLRGDGAPSAQAQGGGAIDIDGHNIDSDGGCGLSAAPAYGNLIHVPLDWMLGPLNTNALLPARFPFPDGPAHDTGSPLDTTLGNPEACFRYDQLGVDRSSNGPCDIGAVEAVHLFGNGFEGIII